MDFFAADVIADISDGDNADVLVVVASFSSALDFLATAPLAGRCPSPSSTSNIPNSPLRVGYICLRLLSL